MSLINQMLKDLESRKQEPLADSGLPQGFHVVDEGPRSVRPGLLLGGVAALVVAVAGSAWFIPAQRERAVAVPSVTQARSPAVLNQDKANVSANEPLTQPGVLPVSLLVEAPSPDSSVVELQNPPPPGEGRVGESTTDSSTVNALQNAPSADTKRGQAPFESPSPQPSPKGRGGKEQGGQKRQLEAMAVTPTTLPRNSTLKATHRPAVALVPDVQADSAEQLYQHAERECASGQLARAMDDLERVLRLQPEHHQARLLLAKTYAAWGDASQALALLDEWPEGETGPEFARLRAQLLIKQGKVDLAEQVLQRANDDAETTGILAALRQRQGRHHEAVALYRRAVARQATQGKWWLGLAISLEAGEHYQEALAAYERGAQAEGLGSESRVYAAQRIAALRGHR